MTHQIRITNSDIVFACEEGDTILDAAERAGFTLPYSCRKGVCATCEGQLVSGKIVLGRTRHVSAPADRVKFCVARADGPIEITPREIGRDAPPLRKRFDAIVHRIDRPQHDVAILHLRLPIGRRAPFKAGQYVQLMLPDSSTRNYSIASAPHDNTSIELHVRRIPGGQFSDKEIARFEAGATLPLELPFGQFVLEDSQSPILMLATGTGFAPMKSMIEDLIRRRVNRKVHLYWGARDQQQLYHAHLAHRWDARFPWFRFTPIVSRPDGWHGRRNLVQDAALADHPDMSGHQVYACGGPAMIEQARQLLVGRARLPESAFHADAFVPAAEIGTFDDQVSA